MPDRAHELTWARQNLKDYLFHRLNEPDDDRLHACLSLVPELNDELDEEELRLIRLGLEGKLQAEDQRDYQRYYADGGPDEQLKVQLERCLKLPEAKVPLQRERQERPGRVIPFRLVAGAAALILLTFGSVLLFREGQRVYRLEGQVAGLTKDLDLWATLQGNSQVRISPRPGPDVEVRGFDPFGLPFVLPAALPNASLNVASPPGRLLWRSDSQQKSYRISVLASDGRSVASERLTPTSSLIEFEVPGSQELPLPWTVTIKIDGAEEGEVAHYRLERRQ
jgi:hypothetical protein